ncbi:DEAD/DEAH box helicase [Agromyces albus]|uniref:DEAD/DEAH box helicase n=1 Tax=Agromyces albus TaxID=205332 RepID=UPI00277FEE00|nr:DEAD/DEAH box helicase [Agromyces albus]MDQ0576620.1 superfamily II DNA or RNA helicase [Agromyces albus]
MTADRQLPAAAEVDRSSGGWRDAVAALSPREAADSAEGRHDDSAASAAPRRPLALQFELRHRIVRRPGSWQGPRDEPARDVASVDRLAVRPVTSGTRGWIKSGITWQNVGYQASAGGFDPAQSRWFGQFALLKGGTPGVYNMYGSEWITLDEFESPLLWALLAEAGRLGIALVGSEATPVVVVGELASIALDARVERADAAIGDLTLTPTVTVDGAPTHATNARLVAGHGLYRFDFASGTIELAPIAAARGRQLSPLGAAQRTAVEHARTVRVPAAELPEFLRAHYPTLARALPVTSRDGSFHPPEPPPATLVLTAGFEPGDVLRLDWHWEHGDGRQSALAASDDDFIDPMADRAVADEVAELLGEPAAPVVLRGIDAAEFTAEVLPLLEGVDRVRVDVLGERPDYREATASPKLTVTTVESLRTDWFDLGVIVTVDGRKVPFGPLFKALSKGAKKLLLVDRTYLSLNQPVFEPLRELIEEAGTLAEWEAGLQIDRSRASLWSEFEDLADVSEPALAWRETVAGLNGGTVEQLPPPAGLALPLRPYQLDGFRWLAFLYRHRLGGILADDMGLGKTAQTLALIAHAVEEASAADAARRPFLVVAPTSVASNWASEAARFTPGLRVATVTTTEAKGTTSIADAAANADLVVTTYAVLRLEAAAFAALEWGALVLDEAQFVKNPATKVHEAALGIRAPFRLAVTGTPMENNLGELWALFNIVAPGLFPSGRAFTERYRRPIEQDRNADRLATLRRRIRPLMLRRTKELVAPELPPKQEQVLHVELGARHRRLYDTFLQRERRKLFGLIDDLDRNRFIVFRSLTLLRMLSLDASLIDPERYASMPSAKLDALFEQLDDVLAEGHRALVFSQFTSFLGRAAARLDAAGVSYAYLDGSTTKRDEVIERFRSGEASVFLISLKAGGFGLNLTEADYVFLLDPWWNPASEAQAVDRAHRIGQAKTVMVYRIVAADTIEEKVMELKARKGELVASIVDDDALFSEALTADDVRGLLGP